MISQKYVAHPSPGYLEMVTEGYRQNSVPVDQINDAINMVCYTSRKMNAGSPYIWSPMSRDYV